MCKQYWDNQDASVVCRQLGYSPYGKHQVSNAATVTCTYSGASLQGTSWRWIPCTVEPLYKGQVGDGSFVPYTVEPLYKGQLSWRWVLCPLYSGASLQGTSWRWVPCTVEPLYKGQVGDGSFVPCTVEPLYKGQVGDGSFVPCTVEPLYKGQLSWRWVLCPLYSGASLQGTIKLEMGPLSLVQWSLSTRDN